MRITDAVGLRGLGVGGRTPGRRALPYAAPRFSDIVRPHQPISEFPPVGNAMLGGCSLLTSAMATWTNEEKWGEEAHDLNEGRGRRGEVTVE